jgi:2-amino-4-hydroxy-6-hydroxymethyldihydropteridine diphosphokinase
MTRAFLGLGSNLGDRAGQLRTAVDGLVDAVAVSPVYETDPVGGPDQGAYLNLVAELDTPLRARELLGLCRTLEGAAGRVREVRWGPRTLDVDVLWVDGEVVADHDLEVPHPRMWERRFVLAPLRDLAPDLVTEAAVAGAAGEVRRLGALDDLAAAAGGGPDTGGV